MINSLDEAYANISALSIFTQSRFILTKVWTGPSFRSFYIEEFMSDCKNVYFRKKEKKMIILQIYRTVNPLYFIEKGTFVKEK